MSPLAFFGNIRSSVKVCPSWQDRFLRVVWLYHDKALLRRFKLSDSQQIAFRYPAPVEDIRVLVRNNYVPMYVCLVKYNVRRNSVHYTTKYQQVLQERCAANG